MSGTISKRQQARNEKMLQELVQTVPGNNVCADCHARNPAWASWSLGVFLCMRCGSIHRKLGTHISKVKSLSMDSWSNEQVENMRKVGNVVSNQIYNPENKKATIPVDADEVDSAMERFIRQKYTNNTASRSGKPNSRSSDEGTPPPLPPKNSSKFGFRSASSIFPLSSRSKKDAKLAASSAHSPTLTNKPSKVFGATVDGDDTDNKISRLRDMGFQDSQRNAIVLKGVNGNLERAIEALVRLGEGDQQSPLPVTSPRHPPLRSTKSLTPMTGGSTGLGVSLSVPEKLGGDRPTTASTGSMNPFDAMMSAQPQTAHSTGSLQNTSNTYHSTNPFGPPSPQAQTDLVSHAFQSLSVSGQPTAQTQPQQTYQQQIYQQHPGSAVQSPQLYNMNFQSSMTYPQPTQQPLQQQALAQQPTGYNPYLSQPPTPSYQPASPQNGISVNTTQTQNNFGNNPFARSPTRIASPTLGQIPEQAAFPLASPSQPFATGTNPYFSSPLQSPVPMMQQPQQPQMYGQPAYGQQQGFPQQAYSPQPYGQQSYFQPQRPDKASIMALYNTPQQLTSPTKPSPESNPYAQTPMIPEGEAVTSQPVQSPIAQVAPQQPPMRSVSQPTLSSTNPFMNRGPTSPPATDALSSGRHISRESMNLGMDMAWTNGRHSPDAFASLSARHV